MTVCLVHDAEGSWRDTVLLSTQVGQSRSAMILAYGKRWSVELAFHDSKQFLGLQDPQVRTAQSVQRAHPMAWFCLSLVILWYALNREVVDKVRRDRPWYKKSVGETFTDMLGALRLWIWRRRVFGEGGEGCLGTSTIEMLLNEMAAVG